jgi:hypothetical protein
VERAAGTVGAIGNILQEINLQVADDPRQVPVRDLKEIFAELDRWVWDIGRAISRAYV